MFLGIVLGCLTYMVFFSAPIIKINIIIINFIKLIIKKFLSFVSFPIKFILRFFRRVFVKPINFILINIRKPFTGKWRKIENCFRKNKKLVKN